MKAFKKWSPYRVPLLISSMTMVVNIQSAQAGDAFAAPNPNADFYAFQTSHENTTPLVNMEFAISDAVSKGNRRLESASEVFTGISNGNNYVNSVYIAPDSTVNGNIILIQESDTFVYSK